MNSSGLTPAALTPAELGPAELGRWALWKTFSLAVLALLITAPAVVAQLPTARLNTVYPPSGQRGQAVEVEVAGVDLDGASELVFSDSGLHGVPKRQPPRPFEDVGVAIPNRFIVTINAETPEGVYLVRVHSRFGVSNPRPFAVGHRTEVPEKEPNESPETAMEIAVGTTVTGRVDKATDVDYFRFAAKKGQRIVANCWAQRLESVLDGILVAIGPDGRELVRSRTSERQDPIVDLVAPADGQYLLKLHDATYRGGADLFYRLDVHSGPHVYFVHPPAGRAGTRGRFMAYGCNLPGGQPAPGIEINGNPLQKLPVEIQFPFEPIAREFHRGTFAEARETGLDGFEYCLQTPQGAANPVFLTFASEPIVLEVEKNDSADAAQKVNVPCEIAGSFFPGYDRDWYEFEARTGDIYWVDLISQRLGLPTDPVFALQRVERNEKGEEKVTEITRGDDLGGPAFGVFDTNTDDAAYRFTAPADGTYRVAVSDLHTTSQSDPRSQYRLAIRRERHDFRLIAMPVPVTGDLGKPVPPQIWNPYLRRGEIVPFNVIALRRDGFGGEIDVTVPGLPKGIVAKKTVIRSGQNNATLYLEVMDDAVDWSGALEILGTAKIGGFERTHVARCGMVVWPSRDNVPALSRVVEELAVAVSGREQVPLRIECTSGAPPEMARGGNLQIPFKLDKKTKFHGKISLQGSNLPPNVKPQVLALDAGKNEGALTLELALNAPPGEYTIFVDTNAEFDFHRRPDILASAKERHAKLEKLIADFTTQKKENPAQQESTKKGITDGTAALEAAKAELEAAKKAEAGANEAKSKAEEEARKIADSVKGAKKPLEALLEAQKTFGEKAAKVVADTNAAAEKRAASDKKLTDTNAALEASKARLAQLEKDEKELPQRITDATAARDQSAKELPEAEKQSAPQKIKGRFFSVPIVVKITPSALVFDGDPVGNRKFKTGEKIEVVVAVRRLYGLGGPLEIQVALPGEAKGLKAANVAIPEGENSGKIVLESAEDGAGGTFKATLKVKAKFNKKDIEISRPLEVTVVKPKRASL